MRRSQGLITWLFCALTVLGCLSGLAAVAYQDYHALTRVSNSASESTTNTTSIVSEPSYSLQTIQSSKLFGTAPSPKPVEQERPKPLPETRLNLKLLGTFTSTESQSASALITDGSNESKRYFVGEQVPGNAELVAVYKDFVTLRRNGRDESLKFPRLSGEDGQMPTASTPASRQQLTQTLPYNQLQQAIEPEPVMADDDELSQRSSATNNNRSSLQERLNRLRSRNNK